MEPRCNGRKCVFAFWANEIKVPISVSKSIPEEDISCHQSAFCPEIKTETHPCTCEPGVSVWNHCQRFVTVTLCLFTLSMHPNISCVFWWLLDAPEDWRKHLGIAVWEPHQNDLKEDFAIFEEDGQYWCYRVLYHNATVIIRTPTFPISVITVLLSPMVMSPVATF